ncbi:ubiquinone biosynthesis protein COQ9 [Nannizzia gypsea CBS 118893]|uniref:Ubiquinone biosynthesis protein n=1 Tax=Arthroderma gypseum (strain ATCC MYA-4604 / CBS 118893) TaxID=535722 RepID=E5QZW6_ARTGP|nr:ubiquinone biosynthesis protein COQ9 [Nannizzia gypsea CBS 118893]EFQ97429.1 ubiquinone biosynthesis protein COQ9 [Nannizzia gypsea CBS 118893]
MLPGSLIRRQLPQAVALGSSTKPLFVSGISCGRSCTALPSSSLRPNSTSFPRYYTRQSHPYSRNVRLRRQSPSSPVASWSRSYYHPASDLSPSNTHFSPEQASILSLALSNYVPRLGFTTEAVVLAAQDAGYPEVSLQLFPRGGEIELIIYWLSTRRALLKEKVQNGEIFAAEEKLSVDKKAKRLVLERLKMNSDIIQHWQDALAVMSLPANISSSLHELYELSSDILYLAGDRSVDSSWYSKRLSVSTVYATAEITMTEDKSEGFTSTEEFVERRFGDSNAITGTVGDVKTYLGFLGGSLVAAGRSLGMKI